MGELEKGRSSEQSWAALARRLIRTARRHPWRTAGGTLAAIILLLAYSLLTTPSWCEPPVVAPEERQQVRNNLIAAEQAFTESLRAGVGPFVYHVYQEDLNRWIVMRREIYPLLDQLTPPEIRDPFVMFDEGRIRIAGRHRDKMLGAVLSLDVTANIEDGNLVLEAVAARVGRIRIPFIFLVDSALTQLVEKDEEQAWPGSPRIDGELLTGLHVGAQARWKNGGVWYRVTDVQVHEGRLDLTIEPLGRQEGVERKHHRSSP